MRCGNTKLVQEWLEDAKVWRWYEGGTQDQQDRLRQMGLEGWELVTVLSVTGASGQTIAFHFFFKCPHE